MNKAQTYDPYEGNLLISGLGPIRSRQQILTSLIELPRRPPADIGEIPMHIRLHLLMDVRDMHIPSQEGACMFETMDLMIRKNYQHIDPNQASTWGNRTGETLSAGRVVKPAYGAAGEGHSGTGKTEAVHRGLALYPAQVIHHKSFPKMTDGHVQVVWQSINVPPSGKAVDLASNLMEAWQHTTGSDRFAANLTKVRPDGAQMLREWRQVASAHFLGLLHLDEVQNFFKISTLEQRRKRSKSGVESPMAHELSIVEDQCIKWILTSMNTWQIPMLLTGTPDGINALTRRLSNTERIVTSGYHAFHPFYGEDDPNFDNFISQLGQYQFVKQRITVDKALRSLIIELTAGIPRLIIALWIAAHRIAFERGTDDLLLTDFSTAAETYLAPVAPAVAALRSGDMKCMQMYEDLAPRDGIFWSDFWNKVSRK